MDDVLQDAFYLPNGSDHFTYVNNYRCKHRHLQREHFSWGGEGAWGCDSVVLWRTKIGLATHI